MIKVMVIAGNSTEQLTKHLIGKGTFEIAFSCDSLHDNLTNIRNNIINVDKLIYYYTEGSSGIDDIKALRTIKNSNNFFTVGEYIFVAVDNEDSKKVKTFFEAAMSMLQINKYTSNMYKNQVGYLDITNLLLGITKTNNFNNTYIDISMVDSSDEAKVSYPQTKDSKLVIEPFSKKQLELNEFNKKNTLKLDGSIRFDDSEDIKIKKYNNLVLPQIELPKYNKKSNIIVVTGGDKTGKSMWSCICACTSFTNERSVCILDYTNNSDIEQTMKRDNISYKSFGMKDILKGSSLNKEKINIISTKNDVETSARVDFLQFLASSEYNFDVDLVVIVTPLDTLNNILYLMSYKIASIWVCSGLIKEDVNKLAPLLIKLTKHYDTKLVLSDFITLKENHSKIDAKIIKTMIPKDIVVIKPLPVKNLNEVGEIIYNQLVLPRIGG